MRANLDRHAACNGTHRGKQGEVAVILHHSLISNGVYLVIQQCLRQFRHRCKMQICKQDQVFTEVLILLRERLLDLEDHVGLGEKAFSIPDNSGPGSSKFRVRYGAAQTAAGLNKHSVSCRGKLLDAPRDSSNPELLVLYFLRDPNDHAFSP